MSQISTCKEYIIQLEICVPELTDYGKELVFEHKNYGYKFLLKTNNLHNTLETLNHFFSFTLK